MYVKGESQMRTKIIGHNRLSKSDTTQSDTDRKEHTTASIGHNSNWTQIETDTQ